MDQSQLYSFYDREPGPIVAFIEYLRDLYRLPRPGVVLDMGCGPGRLLKPLASSNWTVVGYEPDPDYAGSAHAILSATPNGRFRQAGFLDLNETQAFDLIAAVNGPYYYLLEPGQRRAALERCARALKPGGVLFLEFSNFPWILKNYREPPTAEVTIGGVRVTRHARHDIDYHRGTFFHHDRFVWSDDSGNERVVTKTHRMAMVSFPELAFFLREIGFDAIRTYNNYSDREPSELTERRIIVSAQAPVKGFLTRVWS
jgi:SAM-dependent methyltransferase